MRTTLKSGQTGFSVQRDGQCSETYEETIFRFLSFEKWFIFLLNILRKLTKINNQKYPYFFFIQKDLQCSEI